MLTLQNLKDEFEEKNVIESETLNEVKETFE